MKIKNICSIMLAGAVVPASVDKLFNDSILLGIPKYEQHAINPIDKPLIDNSIWMSPPNINGINYHISSNQASTPPDPSLLNDSCVFYFSFITKMQPNSWCDIVLKEPKYIEEVYIKNRSDKYVSQIVGSVIDISLDGVDWTPIYMINRSQVEYKITIKEKVKHVKITQPSCSSLALRSFMVH